MNKRLVPLLPIVFALLAAPFGLAQRGGGGHGGVSAGHMGGGGFGAGSFQAGSFARGSGAFSPARTQVLRTPSLSFEQARRYINAPVSAYNRQPYASYGNRGDGNRGYRNRVGYPYPYSPYGYGLYGGFVPDVLDYPFDSLFDGDGNGYGYGAASATASQAPYPDESYAPPEDYGPQPGPYPGPPYPGPNEEPSAGYRPPYQNSGQSAPPAAQPATALIFQDGRPRELVHNYVLTKTTLYDLDADSRKDIPLADLNLPATIAANRSAGIEFSLPTSY